ncbi:MAG: hypothetical protein MJ084_07195 [Saccharofermentans sp.]|nr:hypothetical protein [Saccharofermentans sp.]
MSTNMRTNGLKAISLTAVFALTAGLMTSCSSIFGGNSGGSGLDLFKGKSFKYVSECDVRIGGDPVLVNDRWRVSKHEYFYSKEDSECIMVVGTFYKPDEAEKYISYYVFDTAREAEAAYERYYDECKRYSCLEDEGIHWFVTRDPGYCDVISVSFYSLERNVIIYSNISFSSGWDDGYWGETQETTVPTETAFDKYKVVDYVAKHGPDLVDYILNDVLLDECSELY